MSFFSCVFSVLLVLRLPRLGKSELILVLFVHLFGLCLFRLSVSSFSWALGRAAVCNCGALWTFLLLFFQNNGEFSDSFPVTNEVKQGCVLASTLFSMMFSAMLTDAFQDGDNGTPIRYRFGWKLFNLRRLQAKPKVQIKVR